MEKHRLELRKLIMDEHRAGLWTTEETRDKIRALDSDSAPPLKRQKSTHSSSLSSTTVPSSSACPSSPNSDMT